MSEIDFTKRCYCCDTENSKTWRKSKIWAEGEPLCNACGTSETRGKKMSEVRAKKASMELEATPIPKSVEEDPDIDVGVAPEPVQTDIVDAIAAVTPPTLVLVADPVPKPKKEPKALKAPKAKKEKVAITLTVKPLKAAKPPKELKVKVVKVVKEKAVKEPKVKIPKEPKVKSPKEPKPPKEPKAKKVKELKAKIGRVRLVRTGEKVPETKECPKCKIVGNTQEMFGTRLMNEKVVPQAQCRKCRREAAALANLKKKGDNEAFKKAKVADKAIQAKKKVTAKPSKKATAAKTPTPPPLAA